MKRLLLAGCIGILFTFSVSAEQPRATVYRQILGSGTYRVEYSTPSVDKMLAVMGGKRIDYTFIKDGSQQVPLGGFKNSDPSAFCFDGKFYQVAETNKAYMAYENQLHNENLDPLKGWGVIRSRLALPPELAIFAPQDLFNRYTGFQEPVFVESGKKKVTVKKKEFSFTYDKYESKYSDAAGGVLYKKIYYALYDDKRVLRRVHTYLLKHGEESLVQDLEVKNISGTVLDKEKTLPKGYVVYRAGIGDINDLIGKNVMVEDYRKGAIIGSAPGAKK